MPNFSTIRAGIVAIIRADPEFAANKGEVFEYDPPINAITKDPVAVVVASENSSDFETTSENKRWYGFTVRIMVERSPLPGGRGAAAAETLMTEIVDRLVQAFDENYTLGVSGVLLTKATPSTWLYVMADKEYRLAEIRLSTMASIDVTP